MAALRLLAARQATLTTDDLWAEVPKPPEPRAVGAVMSHGAQQGWIARTSETWLSGRPSAVLSASRRT